MRTTWSPRVGQVFAGVLLSTMLVGTGAAVFANWRENEIPGNFLYENPGFNTRGKPVAFIKEKIGENGGEASRERLNGPEQEQYDNRAFPQRYVTAERAKKSGEAEDEVERRDDGRRNAWQELGPVTPNVPGPVTYTGLPTTVSGRVTALAVSGKCTAQRCRLFVGAAGGGVWRTDNALAEKPSWKWVSRTLPTNAIGSLLIVRTGDGQDDERIYVGTGEPNGSSDSEAGLGLYVSENGDEWRPVTGSFAVSKDRSIGAIAVDPANTRHIWIGTAVARHGSSSVNGGRFTPPGAPKVGLYESTDGGRTFSLVFSRASDAVDPTSPNGSDFFRGGITKIETDRTGLSKNQPTRIYFSLFGYGLYRGTGTAYEQVFASAGGGDPASSADARTEFATAPIGTKLRIYLGDTGGNAAEFFRVDDANVAAASLTDGTNNPGWTKLSNSTKGTPGFGSYNYCNEQCSYDMPIASPPGKPDAVWIGGQMQYNEIFTRTPPSNGRAIQRSVDAGVNFTDMTNDTQSPAPLGMHPDQHAIVFAPSNPDIAFIGSDGGVVRTSGQFADASADCDSRGLSGPDLTQCKDWLKAIPTRIYSLNDGLRTLQFQSVSVNPNDSSDILGGTQDNGTWSVTANGAFESVGGDGGQSGIDALNPNIRVHSYYSAQHDINFRGTDPLGWNWISDPLLNSNEAASFYVPIITDPKVGGTMFVGLQHVWRTLDNGGPQADLELHCNEYSGDFTTTCGDWVPLGGPTLTGTGYGTDKGGSYVVAVERAPSNTGTMWVATRRGRLFVSQNADAALRTAVTFNRIDTAAQPTRFISGIAVDPKNPNHAFVSFSGYDAYTPTTPGHVFEVTYNPATGSATWVNRSFNIGDQPVTDISYDGKTGDAYVSTDFGVSLLLKGASNWIPAGRGLPRTAVYGLTMSENGRTLLAATHGRGVFKLQLP